MCVILCSVIYRFLSTQASTTSPFNLRGNDKENEFVKQFQRTKQCVGLDCQKWTVTAWSKVNIIRLLEHHCSFLLKKRKSKRAVVALFVSFRLPLKGCGLN